MVKTNRKQLLIIIEVGGRISLIKIEANLKEVGFFVHKVPIPFLFKLISCDLLVSVRGLKSYTFRTGSFS
jgi:hypothetical protein